MVTKCFWWFLEGVTPVGPFFIQWSSFNLSWEIQVVLFALIITRSKITISPTGIKLLSHKYANPLPHNLCCGKVCNMICTFLYILKKLIFNIYSFVFHKVLEHSGHLIVLGGVKDTGITDEILVSRQNQGWSIR